MGTQMLPGEETPDMAEVMQREDAAPAVPVDVVGPVRVQPLPRRSAAVRDLTVTTTAAQRILHNDPTRARAVLLATQDLLVAFTQSQVDGGMGLLGLGKSLELTTTGEVWVKANTVDARVVVWAEYWTC